MPHVLALACRELTLKKGDIVYIHKEVDKNWLEGEHHGRLGIFPANYVEVSRTASSSLAGVDECRGLDCRPLYPFRAPLSSWLLMQVP